MNMGHHALPAVRRNDESLVRYVRSEYGEMDACWLTSSAAKGSCLRLPGESVQKTGDHHGPAGFGDTREIGSLLPRDGRAIRQADARSTCPER